MIQNHKVISGTLLSMTRTGAASVADEVVIRGTLGSRSKNRLRSCARSCEQRRRAVTEHVWAAGGHPHVLW
jgi:hypothetical protein